MMIHVFLNIIIDDYNIHVFLNIIILKILSEIYSQHSKTDLVPFLDGTWYKPREG